MNHQLILNAITAHFACNKVNLECSTKLEDSVEAAKAFYHHLTGHDSVIFLKLIESKRYRNKLELIKRYIKNGTRTRK